MRVCQRQQVGTAGRPFVQDVGRQRAAAEGVAAMRVERLTELGPDRAPSQCDRRGTWLEFVEKVGPAGRKGRRGGNIHVFGAVRQHAFEQRVQQAVRHTPGRSLLRNAQPFDQTFRFLPVEILPVFSFRTPRPAAMDCTRWSATAGLVIYRHRELVQRHGPSSRL